MIDCDFLLNKRVKDTFSGLSLGNAYLLPAIVFSFNR